MERNIIYTTLIILLATNLATGNRIESSESDDDTRPFKGLKENVGYISENIFGNSEQPTCPTCKYTKWTDEPCCDRCKIRTKGSLCRPVKNECDIPEVCDGSHEQCPTDTYKYNGYACGPSKLGYCFDGECRTLDEQCKTIWGYGSKAADKACYIGMNRKGIETGNCGRNKKGKFIKCRGHDALCGRLLCQKGSGIQVPPLSIGQKYSRTVISHKRDNYECKVLTPMGEGKGNKYDMVMNGTRCGSNNFCVNMACVNLYYYMTQKCKSNDIYLECSGHGICTKGNICHCHDDWEGEDCSMRNIKSLYTKPRYQYGVTLPDSEYERTTMRYDPTPGKATTYVSTKGSATLFLVVSFMICLCILSIVCLLIVLCCR